MNTFEEKGLVYLIENGAIAVTYDQIAEEMHISSNTVRNHMAAALDNIRKHLSQHALSAVPPAIICLLYCGK